MKTALSDTVINVRFGDITEGFEPRPANAVGGDELFDLIQNPDGTWSIKSPNGEQWFSVQRDGSWASRDVSDPNQPGPWEKFSRQGNVLTELPKDNITRPLVQLIARDL